MPAVGHGTPLATRRVAHPPGSQSPLSLSCVSGSGWTDEGPLQMGPVAPTSDPTPLLRQERREKRVGPSCGSLHCERIKDQRDLVRGPSIRRRSADLRLVASDQLIEAEQLAHVELGHLVRVPMSQQDHLLVDRGGRPRSGPGSSNQPSGVVTRKAGSIWRAWSKAS